MLKYSSALRGAPRRALAAHPGCRVDLGGLDAVGRDLAAVGWRRGRVAPSPWRFTSTGLQFGKRSSAAQMHTFFLSKRGEPKAPQSCMQLALLGGHGLEDVDRRSER